jgi:choline dehydrogenase-like flavoprotein
MRFLPSDFELRTLHGVGRDWPLRYEDLEPWYLEAERELGVAGDSADDLDSPRSAPYPLPAIPPSYADAQIDAALRPLGLRTRVTPQARNSVPFQNRPVCCGNSTCVPICPIGAKYDASVHAKLTQDAGGRILDQAIAYRIRVGTDGLVSAVDFKRPDGSEESARGKCYVIAAHGVETPRLLLMSRSERWPNGVANTSDQVGRNLMDHPAYVSLALARQPVYGYRGPGETSGLEHMRDGAFRSTHAAFRMPIGNDGWSFGGDTPIALAQKLIGKSQRGRRLREALKEAGLRQVRVAALMEQLPDEHNRVTLADAVDALGLARPRITYAVDDYVKSGAAAARRLADLVFDGLQAAERTHIAEHFGAGHIMGTYRMGTDPKSSVVDVTSRSHDHRNLYLVGSGVFPSSATANPTLTLAALALGTAVSIGDTLRG